MAKTTRQTAIFGVEDWRRIYETYREADFQSYDFETIRKSFVDYLRVHYPESFNDYVESSEFIALLDLIAFMGQSLAFRSDLNARENFIETAERRDSVVKLAELVSYTPKRHESASGYLKVSTVRTTEHIIDHTGTSLSNVTIAWNDVTNPDWYDQFVTIINAALIDSQRVGRPGNTKVVTGLTVDEYTARSLPGFMPVMSYNATVDGRTMQFEAVSATTRGKDHVYEPSPKPSGAFNILFRNDKMGFASPDSGFFLFFKQGSLRSQDVQVVDRIANQVIDVNIDGVNDSDVWLYDLDSDSEVATEWTKQPGLFGRVVAQNDDSQKKFFDVTSRVNDRIGLVFGDGVFSDIPVGTLRVYVRTGNGLGYVLNPSEMSSIPLSMSYMSRTGRVETITFTVSLTRPVSNARPRESIDDIRRRAPARFYTQNRMVNGEDYSNLPFTRYGSVIKSKAINRSSIGSSRYYDLVDITGKYSSTNVYGSDGVLYQENSLGAFAFSWLNRADVLRMIYNQLGPVLAGRDMVHFFYSSTNFPRVDLSGHGVSWHMSTALENQVTGYFKDSSSSPIPVGQFSTNEFQHVRAQALVKFVAPSGFYFDLTNHLRAGVPNGNDSKTEVWATIVGLVLDGTNSGQGNLDDGSGPVTVNEFIPTGAIPVEVIPRYQTDLTPAVVENVVTKVMGSTDFGLGYDYLSQSWYVISSLDLAIDAPFSLDYAQSTDGLGKDASWLVQFTTNGETYEVRYRALQYYFASINEIRFFFDGNQTVFDAKMGKTVNDFVKVLKTNSSPNQTSRLPADVMLDIIGQDTEVDGFVDNFKVRVSYMDSDSDSVADTPAFFTDVVSSTDEVFLQKMVDRDNLERVVPLSPGSVTTLYPTKNEVEIVKFQYVVGTLFYTRSDQKYFDLVYDVNGNKVLSERTDIIMRNGRGSLQFQYKHNSPSSRRIDPGVTNIIDLYVVLGAYYEAFKQYLQDSTGSVPLPRPPSVDELTTLFSGLRDYKMMSDNLVVNTVRFKAIIGSKADPRLQATIKVVKFSNSTVSDSDIKSRVISAINEYFDIENWDFGATFYFSELSAYLHRRVGDAVSSVVLVPKTGDPFGSLYEIRSEPDEIFMSAATVVDVEVTTSLTPSVLRTAQ